MKRLISFVLTIVLCITMSVPAVSSAEQEKKFFSLNDPKLLQNTEDQIYAELSYLFDSEDYIIENVKAIYISQEYLDEFAYNSQANIFFGYTLAELDEEFKDSAYVFTLGDNYETVVQPLEDYDDTFDRVLKNIAIGSGVILVCVTVSVVTGGIGLSTTSMIFAASAKTGTTVALSSGTLGGVAAGVVKGYQTGDFDEALKAAALTGSESFKWGAITGSVTGGLKELSVIRKTSEAVKDAKLYPKNSMEIPKDSPQWRQAELRALNKTGGYEQLSYLNGEKVPFGTPGATRPDIVRNLGNHLEAIEVKYYDLESPGSLSTLYRELEREVSARVANLPQGSTQKIVLDVTGRNFSAETVNKAKESIWDLLKDVYPKIPIEIVGDVIW